MFRNFIFYPLDAYLNDFDLLFDCRPILASAISDNLFPCVLLKMTGAIEQKIKEINWQLADCDMEARRSYLQGGIKDSYKYADVIKLYKSIFKSTNKKKINFDLKRFPDYYLDAFNGLKTKLQNLNYIHTAYKNSWIDFEKDYSKTLSRPSAEREIIEKFNNDYIEKNNNCDIDKFFNAIWTQDFKEKFDKAMDARHRFAHNTFSYQARFSNIASVNDNSKPENYFYYYFLFLYVDKCLMYAASSMLNVYNKKFTVAMCV